jgi:hypothetical protein
MMPRENGSMPGLDIFLPQVDKARFIRDKAKFEVYGEER